MANSSSNSSSTAIFQWPRDSIYGAVILLGAGGAIVHVMSMTMIAYVIGPYSVRVAVDMTVAVGETTLKRGRKDINKK